RYYYILSPIEAETPETPAEPSTPEEGQKPEEGKPEKEDKPAKEDKENTDSPKKKDKAELPKAGSEAEILTLAAVALSTTAGAYVSIRKRK
ncbi:MAG: LPXTG cell wall anchor domain-containing protein, partial [Klebsiella michiganensis]|nr:LPXTG cell wall anchor domain-containing protein [Klebsiella michiganensis]